MFVCAQVRSEKKKFFIFRIKIEFSLENALAFEVKTVFRFISRIGRE